MTAADPLPSPSTWTSACASDPHTANLFRHLSSELAWSPCWTVLITSELRTLEYDIREPHDVTGVTRHETRSKENTEHTQRTIELGRERWPHEEAHFLSSIDDTLDNKVID
jgi:hypothetical protein